MNDHFYMQCALDAAWKFQGLTFPNPAVGACVLGAYGEILGIGAHEKAGEAHAEVLALKAAYLTLTSDQNISAITNAQELHSYLKTHHNNLFKNATIYVTLEPCAHEGKTPSCATLLCDLGLKKVVVSHVDSSVDAKGGMARLRESGIEVVSGVLEVKGAALLHPFTQWQKGTFVTYKWAQRLDGSIDGKAVSSLESRQRVHAMRNVSDLLVIGGNTVRIDRPTLDARLVNGNAPDILIYSKSGDFDKSIPLFSVAGRKVSISDSLESVKNYKNVLIEGGPNLIHEVKAITDCYLSFVSPSSGGTIPFTKEALYFNLLHIDKNEENILFWMRHKEDK